MEEGILKNLKEGNLGAFSRNIEKYISFHTSLGQSESNQQAKFLHFIEDLLRAFSTYLHGKEAGSISQIREIVSDVEKCYKLLQDSTISLIHLTHTNRSFYHIIINLIRLGYYEEAISFSPYLFCNITKISMNHESETLVNNLYIILWNSAMELEQSKESCSMWTAFSLQMRGIALKFLSLKQSHFCKVCEQSSKALTWYVSKAENELCNNVVQVFCTEVWQFIMKSHCSSDVGDNVMAAVTSMFVMLKDWVRTLIRYTTLQNIPLDLQTKLESISCLMKRANDETFLSIGSASINLIKYCLDLLKMYKEKPSRSYSDWNISNIKKHQTTLLSFNAETANTMSSFIDSALYMCLYCLLEVVTLNEAEKDCFFCVTIDCYFALVECITTFFIQKEKYIWNKIDGQPIFTSIYRILGGTIMILRKEIQNLTDKSHVETFIMKARGMLELLPVTLITDNKKYILGKEYIYVANEICNLGIVYFGKELYEKAIVYLELSCQCLSEVLHLEEHSVPDKALMKKTLWRNHELLSHSYLVTGQFETSLNILVDGLIWNSFKASSVIDLWIKIKREVNRKNIIHIKKRTLKEQIENSGIEMDNQCLIELLFAEIKAYRSERYDTGEECYSVATDLLKICKNPLDLARAFIELARTLWLYSDKYLFFIEKSSVECCKEALEILKKLKPEGADYIMVKFLQSLANFWLYQAQMKNLQFAAQREIKRTSSAATETTTTLRGDEEDEAETCDISPAFSYLNIHIQQEVMQPLNQALQLWQELFDSKLDFKNVLSVQDLLELLDVIRTAAEIYSLSQKVIEELKVWSTLRKIAIALNNPVTELQALSMLVTILSRQYLLEAAKSLVDEGQTAMEKVVPLGPVDPYANLSKLKFQLSIANYLFHSEQFVTGLNMLWTILTSPFLQRQTKSSMLLIAEAKITLCHYSLLCPGAFSTISDTNEQSLELIKTASPINLALDSVKVCIGLLKHISSGDNTNQEFPWYKMYLTRIFLDCGLLLGELYVNIGTPKEARCFLCESLTVAQELILANRAASLLLLLAQLDLLCDNTDDCTVKIKGLTYILQFTNNCIDYHDAMQGKQPLSKDVVETEECEQFLKNKTGRTLKGEVRHQLLHITNPQTSPTVKRQQKVVIPSFFTHSNICSCQDCQYFSLHNCFLEVMNLQSSLQSSITKKRKLLEDVLQHHQALLLKRQNNLKLVMSFFEKETRISDSIQLTRSDLCVLCNVYNQLSDLAIDQNKYKEALHCLQSAFLLLSNSSKIYEVVYSDLFSALIYSKTIIYIHYMSKNKITLNYFDALNELADKNENENSDVLHLTEEIKVLNLNNGSSSPNSCSSLFSSPLKIPLKTPAKSLLKEKDPNYSKVCNAPRRKRAPNKCLEAYINSLENVEGKDMALFDYDSKNESLKSLKPSRKTRSQKQDQKILDKVIEQCKQKSFIFDPFDGNANSSKITEKNHFKQTLLSKSSRKVLCEQNDTYLCNTMEDNLNSENETNKTRHCKRNVVTELCPLSRKAATSKRSKSKRKVQPREEIENERGADSDDDLLSLSDFNLNITQDDLHFLGEPDSAICTYKALNSESTGMKGHDPAELFRTDDSSPSRTVPLSYTRKKKACRKTSENKVKISGKSDKENVGESKDGGFAIISSVSNVTFNLAGVQSKDCSIEEKNANDTESPSITLKEVYSELKRALLAIKHHPPCPLYSKMCIVMSLFVILMKKQGKHGIQDDDRFAASYYITESSAVTLKHLALITLSKKIKKCIYSGKESTVQTNHTTLLETSADSVKQNLLNYQKNINVADASEIRKTIDELPKEWTVVQICALPAEFKNTSQEEHILPALLVTRFRAESIPVYAVMDSVTDNAFTENFLVEFNTILKESTATMEKRDAKAWWTVRRSLDSRMKNLIDSMENTWLGSWKGLFLGVPVETVIKEKLTGIILEVKQIADSFSLTCADEYLLEVLLDSSYLLSDTQLLTAISCLWKCKTTDTRCRTLLLAIRKSAIELNFGRINRHPVILILDKKVQALPWESMSLFRNYSVSRVPSLSLLHAQLATYNLQSDCIFRKGVNSQHAFYILNPSNDIPDTQLKFQDIFKKQEGWNGVIGRPPSQQEFSSALTDHDLFIYCGHGTGRVYLAAECIEKLKCSATTILMGCSSGKLKTYGNQLEPNGVVLQYWLGGSPCIVANLWDVTDKDIDRFTESLLKSWLPTFEKSCTTDCKTFITDAIWSAREVCRLPHLIGSAPVIYGLPVYTS